MAVRVIIELPDRDGALAVVQAVDTYKARLRASGERTRRRYDGLPI